MALRPTSGRTPASVWSRNGKSRPASDSFHRHASVPTIGSRVSESRKAPAGVRRRRVRAPAGGVCERELSSDAEQEQDQDEGERRPQKPQQDVDHRVSPHARPYWRGGPFAEISLTPPPGPT